MKAKLLMAALAISTGLPLATAQDEATEPCIHCGIKDRVIADLKAEMRLIQSEAATTQPTATEVAVETLASEAPAAPAIEVVVEEEALPEVAATVETPAQSYTVQAGDGLMKIARKTGCKTAALAAANGLELSSVIHPGQKLSLPTGASSPSAAPTPPKPSTYKIKEGDTYYSLSRRLSIPLDALMAANPKAKATHLYEGRVIKLPAPPMPAPAAPMPAPAAPMPAPASASAAVVDTASQVVEFASEPVSEATAKAAPSTTSEKKIRAVMVDSEITYGEFATEHGTSTERLNSLNDLNLASATILAKGSELYVPAQP